MAVHISGATILDGSGSPARRGDLLLSEGHIAEMGAHIRPPRDARRIDARGLYAAPGFIDVHSHTDLAPFLPGGFDPKLWQGITTDLTGVCGFSPAPVPAERQEGWRRYFIIGAEGARGSWARFNGYLSAVRQAGSPVNMLPFVGHGTLRYAVKGDDPAPLDSAERRRMTSLLEEAAAEGARGLSLGLIYVPALFADRRELHELLTAAGRLELPVTVHLRSESDEMLQALTEMIRLSRETGAYVHISHLKTIGGRNRYKMDEALRLIEGNGLSFDVYPYTYGSTSLLSLLPPQLLKGSSTDALLAGLESPRIAQRVLPYLRGQLRPKPGEPWDNLAQLAGWRGIDIVDIPAGPHAHLQGMTLAEAADALGRSPEETVLHLLARYSGAVRIVDRYTDEETVLKALLHPSGLFSTDTLLGGQPHPRSAGSFPRILRRYVFEHRMISPEEAVAKMSGRSAQVFGLPDRGILAPGKRADLVLFSSSIADRAEPGRPLAPATGVRHLFVRGRAVISDGELTGDLPGEFPG